MWINGFLNLRSTYYTYLVEFEER